MAGLGREGIRIERSVASVVALDPHAGTATKVYRPPAVVRLLYWLAFQARFPYSSNPSALQAAAYRRKIASFLTMHRFGKALVAPVTAVDCVQGEYRLVTQFVSGQKVNNDQAAKSFLAQVATSFSQAGLSVWQISPRNPHAHTNVTLTPEGDYKIVDLESALVTPPTAPGQWRAALKNGNFPVFDDIDFPRLRNFLSTNKADLDQSLGTDGLTQFQRDVDRCEQVMRLWKDAEPRLWGRLARWAYRLLNWSAFFQRARKALAGADGAAQAYLSKGIDRWESEGKLGPSQAADLRHQLACAEARDALHHLGAHLVLTAFLRFPFGSVARLAWTVSFWAKTLIMRFRRGGTATGERVTNIHSPLVMILSVIPGFGAIAYLTARPLRNKVLLRLIVNQIAWKLPFKLYARMRLERWLAPKPEKAKLGTEGRTTVPPKDPVPGPATFVRSGSRQRPRKDTRNRRPLPIPALALSNYLRESRFSNPLVSSIPLANWGSYAPSCSWQPNATDTGGRSRLATRRQRRRTHHTG